MDGIWESYGLGFELGVEMRNQEVEKDVLAEIVDHFPHLHHLLNATAGQFQVMPGDQPDILNQRIVIALSLVIVKYLVLNPLQISLNSRRAFLLSHQPENATHGFDVG